MNYQNGVMPTNEWFEKIKAHVDFKGKNVIDFGCAEGVMSFLALKEGANSVIAIDNQPEMIEQVKFLTRDFDNIRIDLKDLDEASFGIEETDIGIFSMIIHWIGNEFLVMETMRMSKVVIIFRLANDGYAIPTNGIWFPTEEGLDNVMVDFTKIHSEELMEQDNGKKIRLCIYDRKKG